MFFYVVGELPDVVVLKHCGLHFLTVHRAERTDETLEHRGLAEEYNLVQSYFQSNKNATMRRLTNYFDYLCTVFSEISIMYYNNHFTTNNPPVVA